MKRIIILILVLLLTVCLYSMDYEYYDGEAGGGSPEGTDVKSTGEAGGIKFLREDGDGTCSWQTAAGSGDVSKAGTPVDNQLGIWTGDGTIEGDVDLTYDGSTKLQLTGEIWMYYLNSNPRVIIGDHAGAGQYGYLQWDSSNDYFRIETDGTNGLKLKGNKVSIGNIFPSQPLIVGEGAAELFRVQSNGRVGIGTASPAFTLEVNGITKLGGDTTIIGDTMLQDDKKLYLNTAKTTYLYNDSMNSASEYYHNNMLIWSIK